MSTRFNDKDISSEMVLIENDNASDLGKSVIIENPNASDLGKAVFV